MSHQDQGKSRAIQLRWSGSRQDRDLYRQDRDLKAQDVGITIRLRITIELKSGVFRRRTCAARTSTRSKRTSHSRMTTATTQSALLDDVQLTARRIFELIAPELQLVEQEFERQARSNIQVIAYLGEYLRRSGGKRVRPALTILSNYAVGGDGSNVSSIRMATVMEFLHTATVHDE